MANNQFGEGKVDPSLIERIELYGGKVILDFDEELHRYGCTMDGKRLIPAGVTSVIDYLDKSGPLMQWAVNVAMDFIIRSLPCADELVRLEMQGLYAKLKDKKSVDPKDYTVLSVPTDELMKILSKARFEHKAVKEEAASVGKIAHLWLERYIKAKIAKVEHNEPLPDNPKSRSCVLAALDWMGKHDFEPVYSERKIYSIDYNFAGTMDWLGLVTSCGDPKCCPFEGRVMELGDFKSSNAIRETYFFQLAAYLYGLLEEFTDLHIAHRRVLRLGKEDGDFETVVRTEETWEADFDVFLSLVVIFNYFEQGVVNRAHARMVKSLARTKPVSVPKVVRAPIPIESALPVSKAIAERKPRARKGIPVEGVA